MAGHRDIAYLGGLATVLLLATHELTTWLRNSKIVLPTIPEPLAQQLRTQLQHGDRKTVLARLRSEYPHLSLGKAIDLMVAL
jgi:hypothetical protein